MTTPTTISIDGTQYIKATDAGEPTPLQIVVADRGWVFIGHTTRDESGTTITDAKCIRYWGTDNDKPGLGWLAQNGPTSKTKLDPNGTIRIPTHAVVLTFDTDAAKWQ